MCWDQVKEKLGVEAKLEACLQEKLNAERAAEEAKKEAQGALKDNELLNAELKAAREKLHQVI